MTSVERPEGESKPKIEDAYAYNGDGLRTSQTVSGTTSYLAWDTAERLPILLNDGTNSYIYGPGGFPVEQINSEGAPTYLHHDQQGSTRLLTGSDGSVTGSTTYDAYGNETGSTGIMTTPLGYDAQYTSTDTGLIYLRARVYDPATAQFLSVDPKAEVTGAIYSYAHDNPFANGDPSGEDETNAQESEFAHAFLRKWTRLEKEQFAYLPTSLSEDLQELKVYEFEVGLYDPTQDEELERTRYIQLYQQQQIVNKIVFAKLVELEGLETVNSVNGAIKDLVKMGLGLVGIKI